MAGYDYQRGMSNNAVGAYEDGRMPLSKIRKSDLQSVGLEITVKFAKWLASEGYWRASEWHHTGGTWYNKADFYCPSELAESIDDGDIDIVKLQKSYKNDQEKTILEDEESPTYVKGSYKIWGGSRRRPKIVGHQEFFGTISGNWIITYGGERKKSDGNHLEYSFLNEKEYKKLARKEEKRLKQERLENLEQSKKRAIRACFGSTTDRYKDNEAICDTVDKINRAITYSGLEKHKITLQKLIGELEKRKKEEEEKRRLDIAQKKEK